MQKEVKFLVPKAITQRTSSNMKGIRIALYVLRGRSLPEEGSMNTGKLLYAYYGANCSECPLRSECGGRYRRRVITTERRRMAAKMRSQEGKEEYKKRKETVEWPFGNMKHNLKFLGFLTRGIESVMMEHNLVCTAHNLKVMWAKLGGKVAVLCKIGNLVANSASKAWNFFRISSNIRLEVLFWGLIC